MWEGAYFRLYIKYEDAYFWEVLIFRKIRYTFIIMKKEKKWVKAEEKLSWPLIRPVWRMLLSKGAELIKRMNNELARDPKAPIIEK